MYVNTDNLIVRDRPDSNYIVHIILNKNCRVNIEKYDSFYKNNYGVLKRYYRISFTYNTTNNIKRYVSGWVEKKYLSTKKSSSISDTDTLKLYIDVNLIPYSGGSENNPNKNNRFMYPYPKFKGGEKLLDEKSINRKYLLGPRGGCYYINTRGKKVYVDKKFCRKLNLK